MSERTEVEVLLPLDRLPTRQDWPELRRIAFVEARRLVRPGRVLGIIGTAYAEHAITGAPALKIRFAVQAPEAAQPHRSSFATS